MPLVNLPSSFSFFSLSVFLSLQYCPKELLSSILRLLSANSVSESSSSSSSSSPRVSLSSPPETLRALSALQLSHVPVLLSSLVKARTDADREGDLRDFLVAYADHLSSSFLFLCSSQSTASLSSHQELGQGSPPASSSSSSSSSTLPADRKEAKEDTSEHVAGTSSSYLSQEETEKKKKMLISSSSSLHPLHSLPDPARVFTLNDLSFIAIGMSTLGFRNLSFLSLLAEAVTLELERMSETGRNLEEEERSLGRRRRGEGSRRGQEEEDEEEQFLMIRKARQCSPFVSCLFSFSTLGVLHPRLYHRLFASLRRTSACFSFCKQIDLFFLSLSSQEGKRKRKSERKNTFLLAERSSASHPHHPLVDTLALLTPLPQKQII